MLNSTTVYGDSVFEQALKNATFKSISNAAKTVKLTADVT